MVLGLIPYLLATEETELSGRSASATILILYLIESLFDLIVVLFLLYINSTVMAASFLGSTL
jgi:hypothetical protein